ncbi:MAG: hypothetical protein OXP66_11370 [Candidatus Tectomicrobia bacterium]|nr:hypothetical protein [Candidatus Tectomicrobia bacterium]
MKPWLKDNGTVIGALAGVLVAFVAVLQLVVVGPMNRRFDAQERYIEQRFNQQDRYINARFDAVDQRFEAVDQRFEAVDQRFDDLRAEMNQRFNQQDQRLDQLTDEVSALRALVVGIGERVSRNEGAIGVIREQLQAEGASPASP